MTKLREVLLVDDLPADNFLNKLLLQRLDCAEKISMALNGREALDYLTTPVDGARPDVELIILDINMPIMDGWEFLEAYEKLPPEQRAAAVLMMLTTSMNPDDEARARSKESIDRFAVKPLTEETFRRLLEEQFPGRF
ncbi:MAG: response regulator [Deltaproteobacteria bacterium]|jgi:CheY-like chemotaxis protein